MPSVNIQPHPSLPQNTNSTTSHVATTLNDEKEDENHLNQNQNGTGISIINNANKKTNVIKPSITKRHDDDDDDDDMSNETNEFVRLRDGMERQAFEWLEQELLSHFISKMANQHDQNENGNHNINLDFLNENEQHQQKDTIDSQTLMLMNFLGKKGFQLFVDMGLEVDPNLIELLIREVLEEKIANMISSETNESHVDNQHEEEEEEEEEDEDDLVQKQQPQPQPSPRRTIEYLENHQKNERPLSLDIDTPIPTPPSHRSPTSTRPIIITPTQPPQLPHETTIKEPKQKHYILIEEEENFSELDVTLEEENEEDDLQGD